jgi:CheY-like chemotaxis protein
MEAPFVVYVLDDDPAVLKVLGRALEAQGFATRCSSLWSEIGQELIAKRRGAERNLALVCDVNMPGIRGEDFCRTMLRHNPELRLILYSGQTEPEVQEVAGRLGGVPFVTKRQGVDGLGRALHLIRRELEGGPPPATRTAPRPGPRQAWLVGAGLPDPLQVTRRLVVGRGPGRDVTLSGKNVSRQHLTLSPCDDGSVEVRDLGSRNGTLIDGRPLRDASVRLGVTATIEVGAERLTLLFDHDGARARELAAKLADTDAAGLRLPGRPTDDDTLVDLRPVEGPR